MKGVVLIVTAVALAGCSSLEEREAHMRGQIEIVGCMRLWRLLPWRIQSRLLR